jgi:ferredoxin
MIESPVSINESLCTGCGLCGTVCPRHVPVTTGEKADKKTVISQERVDVCMRCGQCAAVCPSGAVTVEGLDPAGFAPLPDWDVSYEKLMGVLASRRSVRRYKKEPVSREVLDRILEAAALAPTGTGSCSTGVIVIDSPGKLSEISDHAYKLYTNLDKALSSPVARFFVSRKLGKRKLGTLESFVMPAFRLYRKWHEEGKSDELRRDAPAVMFFTSPVDEPEGDMNCMIAAYHAVLAAHVLHVGTCINGLLPPACNRSPEIRRLINLSAGREVYACITMGYPKYRFERIIPRRLATVTYG